MVFILFSLVILGDNLSINTHLSSEKNPGWLFDIGDEILPKLYGDYFISQYKDPY